MSFRCGVRIALDVGAVRIGIAKCDPAATLSTPVATFKRSKDESADMRKLVALLEEYEPIEIVIGLPLTLSGEYGPAATKINDFVQKLAKLTAIPLRLVDERMSTAAAQRGLHDAGRSTRTSRSVIDQAAAVLILESAIDQEKNTGRPAGRVFPRT